MNLIAGKTVSIDFESRYKDVLVVPSSITETVVVASGIDTAIPVAVTPSTVGVTFLGFVVPADSEPGTKFFVRMTAIVGGVELSTTKPVGIVGVDVEARLTAQDACLEEIKSRTGGASGVIQIDTAAQSTMQQVCVNDSNGIPINCVKVSITSDAVGQVLLAEGHTEGDGKFEFELVAPFPDSIYVWRCKCGFRFVSPVKVDLGSV